PTVASNASGIQPPADCFSAGTRSSAELSTKTSESSASRYLGSALDVFLVIDAIESVQPRPKGPLPPPESYLSSRLGANPCRPGETEIGTERDAAPVGCPTVSFSSIPRIAPPPVGREIRGSSGALDFSASPVIGRPLTARSSFAACG